MAGYETWCTILRNADAKDTCPFTRQPLRRRELVKLTHDNIAEYRGMMVGTQGGGRLAEAGGGGRQAEAGGC